jgi:hypothetical protein
MNTICPHCKQKYEVESQMAGQVAQCQGCNKEFTIQISPPTPPVSGQRRDFKTNVQRTPDKQPVETSSDVIEKTMNDTRTGTPSGIVLAAILCSLWALLTILRSLHTIFVVAMGDDSLSLREAVVPLTAVWNMMISAVYILFTVRMLSRDRRWGFDWPLGTNILNAVLSIIHILRCLDVSSPFARKYGAHLFFAEIGSFTLPVELAIVLLLVFNRKWFSNELSLPGTFSRI